MKQLTPADMSEQARTHAESVFAAVDRQDAAAFAEFFAPDGIFVFGNGPEIQGPGAIREAVHRFFAAIAALRHDLLDVWQIDDTVICRIAVTYMRHDGRSLTLPCANIWRRAGNEIKDYRIYIDLAPLFAPSLR